MSELKKSEASSSDSPASTRCSTPTINLVEAVVRDMACALLEVSQGVGDKYLKEPLGEFVSKVKSETYTERTTFISTSPNFLSKPGILLTI